MIVNELITPRLKLRRWTKQDYLPFAALNADPRVMKYFPAILSVEQSNQMADSIVSRLSERGWGFWALEIQLTKQFAGFVGLNVPKTVLPFSPCVEIGWRLDNKYWGCGYATEAGRAVLRFAFEELGLSEVMSFTSVHNQRSRAVMKRLGMRDSGRNFMHPDIAEGRPLREHVLYRLDRISWEMERGKP